MVAYVGTTYHSSVMGNRIAGVACEQCGCQYFYELTRTGTGSGTSHYGLGSTSARNNADEKSQANVVERLSSEAELVPCPKCHWISSSLVDGYRLSQYQNLSQIAGLIGIVGTIISLIMGWFIHIGPAADRGSLWYVLIGGPALSITLEILLIGLRNRLRSRIKPNRSFPQMPELPVGTPPALLLDPVTQTLNVAVRPEAASTSDWHNIQLGRDQLPQYCCECLGEPDAKSAYTVDLAPAVRVQVPRCATCKSAAKAKGRRRFALVTLFVIPVGIIAIGLMGLDQATNVTLYTVFVLAGLILALVDSFNVSVPAQIRFADQGRGVVAFKFRNPSYLQKIRTEQAVQSARAA